MCISILNCLYYNYWTNDIFINIFYYLWNLKNKALIIAIFTKWLLFEKVIFIYVNDCHCYFLFHSRIKQYLFIIDFCLTWNLFSCTEEKWWIKFIIGIIFNFSNKLYRYMVIWNDVWLIFNLKMIIFDVFRIFQILCTILAWDLITSNSNHNNIIIDVKHLVPHIISLTICLGNCNSQLIRRTCTWPVRDTLGHSHTRTRGLTLVKIKVV